MPPTLFDDAPRPVAVQAAVDEMGRADHGDRGAVFTRREVVDFVLDLAGYTADRDLPGCRLLEPSAGDGEFVRAAVGRLFDSYYARGGRPDRAADDLAGAVRAVEVHGDSVHGLRETLWAVLGGFDLDRPSVAALIDAWVVHDDFLLAPLDGPFTHVVGNPPYVRQERVAPALLAEYRARYRTVYDRADLYVPFFERGLRLLAPGGRLGYVCADRWTKNRYGGPLRELVSGGYHLEAYADLDGVRAFASDVSAYPSVFVLARTPAPGIDPDRRPTAVAAVESLDPDRIGALALTMRATIYETSGDGAAGDGATGAPPRPDAPGPLAGAVHVARGVVRGPDPWVLDTTGEVDLLRRLEDAFPTLEESGCRVGIGVATGADRVFIRPMADLDVEPERRLPLALAGDLGRSAGGGTAVRWSGAGLLNPYEPDGSLADLDAYPRFAAYVRAHGDALRRRHTAKKSPDKWYKTIDRVWPALTARPKLLIPDIKGSATVGYDPGELYPHHNLYYVVVQDETADEDAWDLRALQAALRSRVAEFFVQTYAVKMRGGYLRFQAQYVRRIRVPFWRDVPEALRAQLVAAAALGRQHCDAAAVDLYGLTPDEEALVVEATGGAGW